MGFHPRPAELTASRNLRRRRGSCELPPNPALSPSPFSVQLPKEFGDVTLGELPNVCDLNFPACKMGNDSSASGLNEMIHGKCV